MNLKARFMVTMLLLLIVTCTYGNESDSPESRFRRAKRLKLGRFKRGADTLCCRWNYSGGKLNSYEQEAVLVSFIVGAAVLIEVRMINMQKHLEKLHKEETVSIRNNLLEAHHEEMVSLRNELLLAHSEEISSLRKELSAAHSEDISSVRKDLSSAHSEEISSVRTELLAAYSEEISSVRTKLLAAYSEEVSSVRTELLGAHQNEFVSIRNEMLKLFDTTMTSGAIFIVWGRKTCSNDNTIIYSGMVCGGRYSNQGSSVEPICLPFEPIFGSRPYKADHDYLYGSAYVKDDFYGSGTSKHDVPCAVCNSKRSKVLMIPGRNRCYDGWNEEYHGYLSSGHIYNKRGSRYTCMHDVPDVLPGDSSNYEGYAFNPVLGVCGSLKCPPYINLKPITCVVCSS